MQNTNISEIIENNSELGKITYDGALCLALGKSRHEKNWKNKTLQWSAVLNKIQQTHRTAETHAEYMAATRTRQDEIKDIGGFVGGYLKGGRRKSESLVYRQMITLDLDHATPESWDAFNMLYDCAAAVYSTHKHTPESPRLRLLIPLDREVLADEYEAIGRRIAGDLGIEQFDNTGFEPSRLMYWPSTSKDGEYYFQYQDGPWLNADKVLSRYYDWKDSSEWPLSEKVDKIVHRQMKKQQDPNTKAGLIGAFCRTYNIHEAIEKYLPDVYEPCDIENRYTYKLGSTAAGLIVYDDKFAFSHHGTDPISGKLCNAFDLVRIHLFGLQDEDNETETASVNSMFELVQNDPKVKSQMVADDFSDDFKDNDIEKLSIDNSWKQKLEFNKRGKLTSIIDNQVLLLSNSPKTIDLIGFNDFTKEECLLRKPFWSGPGETYPRPMTDFDDAQLRRYLQKVHKITPGSFFNDAIKIVAGENKFHPVKQYLESQSWDGEKRIETLLIDYLGAEDSPYTRAVIVKSLTAAVARIFEPGTTFQYVTTLVGPQGSFKSTFLKKLGGDFFTDSLGVHKFNSKDGEEGIQGVWIVELGEMAGLRKTEVETVKNFISRNDDRYRVAYGKRVERFQRQCVFFGTTNDDDFLRDPTGNRRFWPVRVRINQPSKNVFTDLTRDEVGQIWAEAVQLYRAGEQLCLGPELEDQAFTKQADHTETDERVGLIRDYLDRLLPPKWDGMSLGERRSFLTSDPDDDDSIEPKGVNIRDSVCVAEIWCELLCQNRVDLNPNNTKSLHRIMRGFDDWKLAPYNKKFKLYGQHKNYVRVKRVKSNARSNAT